MNTWNTLGVSPNAAFAANASPHQMSGGIPMQKNMYQIQSATNPPHYPPRAIPNKPINAFFGIGAK